MSAIKRCSITFIIIRGSSVTKLTGYALDDRGSISEWGRDFSLSHNFLTGYGVHTASYPVDIRDYFPRNNVTRAKAHSLLPSCTEVNNVWAATNYILFCLSLSSSSSSSSAIGIFVFVDVLSVYINLGDLSLDGRIILKWISKKYVVRV
jgi:hypothetical protein